MQKRVADIVMGHAAPAGGAGTRLRAVSRVVASPHGKRRIGLADGTHAIRYGAGMLDAQVDLMIACFRL